MSTTLIIILVVMALVVMFITVNYFRMKNAKPVETSKKIITLGNKNFKLALKKEVLLVDFWAPWCGPCKIIAPTLNEIAETETHIVVGKVNVDYNQDLARKYKVRNIPTMLIFKNGAEVGRIVGVKTKKAILNEVRSAVAVSGKPDV
ncbi:MAG: thioredoxin [Prolixibacteraceae bacterium]|mgnify:CR=1 FL=1|nr:MAG: thioredoxin [Prolixibacteraceae bacterium]